MRALYVCLSVCVCSNRSIKMAQRTAMLDIIKNYRKCVWQCELLGSAKKCVVVTTNVKPHTHTHTHTTVPSTQPAGVASW